jgi:hypothetical protein
MMTDFSARQRPCAASAVSWRSIWATVFWYISAIGTNMRTTPEQAARAGLELTRAGTPFRRGGDWKSRLIAALLEELTSEPHSFALHDTRAAGFIRSSVGWDVPPDWHTQYQEYARLLSENTLQGTGTHRTSGRQAQTLQAYRTSMREDGAELPLVRRACSRLHLDQIRHTA